MCICVICVVFLARNDICAHEIKINKFVKWCIHTAHTHTYTHIILQTRYERTRISISHMCIVHPSLFPIRIQHLPCGRTVHTIHLFCANISSPPPPPLILFLSFSSIRRFLGILMTYTKKNPNTLAILPCVLQNAIDLRVANKTSNIHCSHTNGRRQSFR